MTRKAKGSVARVSLIYAVSIASIPFRNLKTSVDIRTQKEAISRNNQRRRREPDRKKDIVTFEV